MDFAEGEYQQRVACDRYLFLASTFGVVWIFTVTDSVSDCETLTRLQMIDITLDACEADEPVRMLEASCIPDPSSTESKMRETEQ